jgi:glutaredoxin 3
MRAIVYSKILCPYCEMAKKLLQKKGVSYEELIIDVDISLQKAFGEIGTSFKSVPQIVLDGTHIPGYNALVEYFKKKEQNNGKPK